MNGWSYGSIALSTKMPPPTRRTGSVGARGTGREDEGFHLESRPVDCLPQVDKKCQQFKT